MRVRRFHLGRLLPARLPVRVAARGAFELRRAPDDSSDSCFRLQNNFLLRAAWCEKNSTQETNATRTTERFFFFIKYRY